MKIRLPLVVLGFLLLTGVVDATLLTIEHYKYLQPQPFILPCSVNSVIDCGKVLQSPYATIFGIPLAVLGLLYYGVITILLITLIQFRKQVLFFFLFSLTAVGVLFSGYLLYVQAALINRFCVYCLISGLVSVGIYLTVRYTWPAEHRSLCIARTHIAYRIVRPIIFLMPSELIHTLCVRFGELLGTIPIFRWLFRYWYVDTTYPLAQTVAGIRFPSPIGLSAGFDYEARLTQILPECGCGFMTVGTITKSPFEGNTPPRLGRLVKSQSLMVNKGFKNPGADAIIKKLEGKQCIVPLGISIGITNTNSLKTEASAIKDITDTFSKFEKSRICHSYYELNISCPNLKSSIEFYAPSALSSLLSAVTRMKSKRPIFIKMPINKTNKEIELMLDVIVKYKMAGVIFGNLQKDRTYKGFVKKELQHYPVGNFSGKPTWERSNELIALTHKKYGKKLVIIGCGGVFSAEDAKEKMRRGASLVQLITGMIFEGPQLMAEINSEIANHTENILQ